MKPVAPVMKTSLEDMIVSVKMREVEVFEVFEMFD